MRNAWVSALVALTMAGSVMLPAAGEWQTAGGAVRAGELLEGHAVSLVSFVPGTPAEDEGWRDPSAAFGVGDCIIDQLGGRPPDGCMVSLGRGGQLEVILDVPATADGTSTADLLVGECCERWELDGPFDQLRIEGLTSEGQVLVTREGAGRQAIDLDELGLRPFDPITRVRITDITTQDVPDDNAGADIDSLTSHRAVNAVPSATILGQWREVGTSARLTFSPGVDEQAGIIGYLPPGSTECRSLRELQLVTNQGAFEVGGRDCHDDAVRGFALLDDATSMRVCLRPAAAGASVPHECSDWFAQLREPVLFIGNDDLAIAFFVLWVLHVLLGLDDPGDQPAFTQAGSGPLVYAATNAAFPDALAVAGITGLSQGFTLLVDPDDPAGNAELLDGLDPSEIVVIGGTAAIPDDAIPDDGTPRRRLGGASRFDTAALLSREHFAPGVATVYIATGNNYPDALAGGAIASIDHAPILLVDGETIPSPTATELRRLNPGRIVILGGTAAIADTVATQLQTYTSGPVTRIAGPDRIATAVAASQAAFPDGADMVMVANAEDFRNAEGAAGAAWAVNGPLLLVRPDGPVPPEVRTEIGRLNPDRLLVITAEEELSTAVLAELDQLR